MKIGRPLISVKRERTLRQVRIEANLKQQVPRSDGQIIYGVEADGRFFLCAHCARAARLALNSRWGRTFGRPNDPPLQTRILRDALGLLTTPRESGQIEIREYE